MHSTFLELPFMKEESSILQTRLFLPISKKQTRPHTLKMYIDTSCLSHRSLPQAKEHICLVGVDAQMGIRKGRSSWDLWWSSHRPSNHELAAVAILGKAELLRDMEQFSNAIDTYQSAIRRFPRSHHALQAFKGIAESYVEAIQLNRKTLTQLH